MPGEGQTRHQEPVSSYSAVLCAGFSPLVNLLPSGEVPQGEPLPTEGWNKNQVTWSEP